MLSIFIKDTSELIRQKIGAIGYPVMNYEQYEGDNNALVVLIDSLSSERPR